jgi:hypothetical protein
MAGVAIKIAYANIRKGASYDVPKDANELLGASCGAAQLSLAISRWMHKGKKLASSF